MLQDMHYAEFAEDEVSTILRLFEMQAHLTSMNRVKLF